MSDANKFGHTFEVGDEVICSNYYGTSSDITLMTVVKVTPKMVRVAKDPYGKGVLRQKSSCFNLTQFAKGEGEAHDG